MVPFQHRLKHLQGFYLVPVTTTITNQTRTSPGFSHRCIYKVLLSLFEPTAMLLTVHPFSEQGAVLPDLSALVMKKSVFYD